MSSSRDISSREDIELLVDSFYKKVLDDDVIGHFFNEVAEIDWDKHMPIMYDFWETTLLGTLSYTGNPMAKHFDLHKKSPLAVQHFQRWLELWKETVLELFEGDKANETIQRATTIAKLMEFKVVNS